MNFIVSSHFWFVIIGLPAIKPLFMHGPAYRARQAKLEEQLEFVSPPSDSDTDDEWTPHMEQKKAQKGCSYETLRLIQIIPYSIFFNFFVKANERK